MNNIRAYIANYHYFFWLIFFEFLFGSPVLTNQTFAQNLHDVKIKTATSNVSLEQAIKFIEQNTKFSFTYNKETLPLDSKVQLTEGEIPLYDLLYNLARYYGLTFHRISNQIVIKKTETATQNLIEEDDYGLIEGKVIDITTKTALSYASVYFAQTTIGVLTDKDGYYRISKALPGKYTLIISQIGYEPFIEKIEIAAGITIRKNFSLKAQPIQMNPIIVADQSKEYDAYLKEQKNYREVFKKYFLGQTNFSDECTIDNIEAISFDRKYEIYIEATCLEPIVIINKALGYKIECRLIQFLCIDNRMDLTYEFYPKFTELTPENEKEKKKWDKNRTTAFRSSLRRFLLSKMHTTIQPNDYLIYPQNRTVTSPVLARNVQFYFDNKVNLYYLKFQNYLYVENQLNGEISFIFLPKGISYLDPGGYPFDPMSIQVSGVFAKHGIANLLPLDISYLEWEEQKDE